MQPELNEVLRLVARLGGFLARKGDGDTPQGQVWTDRWGRAVVPRLSAYSSNRVEVMTSTLPRNVDIGNGF